MSRPKRIEKSSCLYCAEPAKSLGMCSKHYQRYNKYGDPHYVIRPRKADISYVGKDSPAPINKAVPLESKMFSSTIKQNQRLLPISSKQTTPPTVKATGIVRRVDELGRIVLPREFGRSKDIHPGDNLEFFVTEDQIALKKYAPGCVFCGSIGDLIIFKEKQICRSCICESRAN